MNRQEAYRIFEHLIKVVSHEIVDFTAKNELNVKMKRNQTIVTKCDDHIDKLHLKFLQGITA